MDKCSYLLVFLALGLILTLGQCFPHIVDKGGNSEEFEYVVLDSYNILQENFTHIVPSKVQTKTTYSRGQRESGDHLVAWGKGGRTFFLPTFLGVKIQYPKSGVGALVTYVTCVVDQLLTGQAYIVSGGIGQHHITFVIESYFTTYFYLDCDIYGK